MEEEIQIRHFKLINGDQIIAAVNSKNKDNWFLGTPVQVSNALLGGFSFSPWFPFSTEENYKVKFHNVIQSTLVDNDIKEAYIKFVLQLKENPPKNVKKMSTRASEELLNELEDSIMDEEMNEVFQKDIVKKETIH
tara:strand:+ start:85 stop:492 length:408 start_codon:yes stop_codon:yes gene_type:complete